MPIFFFFFNDTATTEIYTLSLHDALPIFFFASASGRYGSGPSLTTPKPAGIPPAAPITTSGPAFASWAWISHSAVFMACQIPLKFGLPSAVPGGLVFWAAAGGTAGGPAPRPAPALYP